VVVVVGVEVNVVPVLVVKVPGSIVGDVVKVAVGVPATRRCPVGIGGMENLVVVDRRWMISWAGVIRSIPTIAAPITPIPTVAAIATALTTGVILGLGR
jgi:hypothetical protein